MRYFVAALLWCLSVTQIWAMSDIKTVTSKGGIEAWLVEEHNIPFVALEIVFQGGAALDPADKLGAVNFMAGLLEEGAGTRDAQEFAVAREELAASFGFSAGMESVSISARFLTENRDEALALLREAIVAPRFDADAIERVREQILAGLRSDAKDPTDIASNAFARAVFGDHPYGRPSQGTIETVTALTREDLVAAHKNALVRDRVFVSAVGDIAAAELGALLDDLLGALPATSASALPAPINVATKAGVTVEEFPVPQSVVVFGHEGMSSDDPDFFAAYVLNVIFSSGGFESRLMSEVREKRGLTYGIGAYLIGYDQADLLWGQFSSANEKVAEALDVIRDEWVKIANEGVTEDELDRAKTYLTGAYPLRFDGNARIANILVGMAKDGYSPDYPKTRNDKIRAVTLDDVNRVAQRLFQPEKLWFMVVGQPEGL